MKLEELLYTRSVVHETQLTGPGALTHCIKLGKWYVCDYTTEDLTEVFKNTVTPTAHYYTTDYALFTQHIKLKLISKGLTKIKNHIFTNEYYNFELLGHPITHPDRSKTHTFMFTQLVSLAAPKLPSKMKLTDTTIVKTETGWCSPLSLTTHTTANIWAAVSEGGVNTQSAFVIGRVIRREREDKTHAIEFEHLELFIKQMTFEKLSTYLITLLSELDLTVELRRTKYNYVEPGLELVTTNNERELEIGGTGLFTSAICDLFNIKTKVLGAGLGLARLYTLLYNKTHISEISEI